MQSEFSEKRHIVPKDELVNYFAVAQTLPGIVAANMTMFIGYRLKGKMGAVAAMIGVIFVPFWCIVILASVLDKFVNNSFVQGAMWGVSVAVIALIVLTVREMWQNSKRNLFFYLIFLSALIALLIFKMSPIHTILLFSVFGVMIKIFLKKEVNK